MNRLQIEKPPVAVWIVWAALAVAGGEALLTGRLSLAFIALVTFRLTLVPLVQPERVGLKLLKWFTAAIVLFIFATIFLGEAFDFYERFAWWDMVLHGGSAMGFGIVGFLFAFVLFEGDKYAAPPWALAFIGFTVAMTIGATWEIFEFGMDQIFGLNMQKSGLMDTMGDLIVDMIGAALGGLMGFLYLKGVEAGGPLSLIAQFVTLNRRLFRRRRDRP